MRKKLSVGAVSTFLSQWLQLTWNAANGYDAQNGDDTSPSMPFTALDTSTRIIFKSRHPYPSNCGPVLAAISLTANKCPGIDMER